MRRLFLCLFVLVSLGACTAQRQLDQPLSDLGNFKLGHAAVVAPNLVKGPVSRDASPEEWIAGVDKAIEDRFRRYTGSNFYHLGISVEGYVLAQPGVPLVLSPKSALILRVTLWDDAKGVKLNEEPHQITVLESLSPETVVGSGLTKSKAQQLENLSFNAAFLIEKWLIKMNKENGWMGGETEGFAEAQAIAQAQTDASEAVEVAPEETQ